MRGVFIGRHFYENVMRLIQKSVWYTQNPTCQQGVEQLQVLPSSKNVSSRMVADNNADTVATHPAVSKNRLATEEYEGVYCSWDRLI